MSFAIVFTECINCRAPITINPVKSPSITVNGNREPLCKCCFNKWNQIHRIGKGLDPIPLDPDAYKPCDESQLL